MTTKDQHTSNVPTEAKTYPLEWVEDADFCIAKTPLGCAMVHAHAGLFFMRFSDEHKFGPYNSAEQAISEFEAWFNNAINQIVNGGEK